MSPKNSDIVKLLMQKALLDCYDLHYVLSRHLSWLDALVR